MIKHQLNLAYSLGPGWLTPWVDALSVGAALGYRCAQCGKTSFPPERCCPCGGTLGAWVALTGRAEIVERTDGPVESFALVRFEGADTMTTVRLDRVASHAREARLKPAGAGLPALVLTTENGDALP